MESYGLLCCVLQLWTTSKLFVRRFVIDDDATNKAQVRHSLKELVAAGRMSRADWPKTAGGNEKKSTDRLPLEHPPVEFVADHNHRVRQFGGDLYALEHASLAVSTMTKPDMQRMKRNFFFWLFKKVRKDIVNFLICSTVTNNCSTAG